MLQLSYSKQFQKDLKNNQKRGKNIDKKKLVIENLVYERKLDSRLKDHKLVGIYQGRRESHIEPDWLLIYKLTSQEIIFERTGSHSDLFKK
jgi:mRNA interferase YafQ